MKGYLLDTNLLIALLWPGHEKHDLALKWFTRHRAKGWATCPFTQAGFVRIVSNPAFSRDAVQPREAAQVLSANTAAKDHEFWPDVLPFAEAVAFAGVRLLGHQQVTDAYLLGLAIRRGGVLATLDQRIAALTEPKSAERKALETVA
ncbi:MAG: TA system VapC family ribonuclease toxin [Limisphaerales bacterium]